MAKRKVQLSKSERQLALRNPMAFRKLMARKRVVAIAQAHTAIANAARLALANAQARSKPMPAPEREDEYEDDGEETAGMYSGVEVGHICHGTDEYISAKVPVMLTHRCGAKSHPMRGVIHLVVKLEPQAELSGVDFGAMSTEAAKAARAVFWKAARERLREAFLRVIRSPATALAAGVSFLMGGWGRVFATLYAGTRALTGLVAPNAPA